MIRKTLTQESLKSISDYLDSRNVVDEIIAEVKSTKDLSEFDVKTIIYCCLSMPSQAFGSFIERYVCDINGFVRGRKANLPDATDSFGKTYEIKGTRSDRDNKLHVVQYRPGTTDYMVIAEVTRDAINLFKIPEDKLSFLSWSVAHGVNNGRNKDLEYRTTIPVASPEYDILRDEYLYNRLVA